MMSSPNISSNVGKAKLYALAGEHGFEVQALAWILLAINTLSKRASASEGQVSAKELCVALIKDMNHITSGKMEAKLREMKFESSSDIGRMVQALSNNGLIRESPQDSPKDFEGLFTSTTLDDFLSKEGIKRVRLNTRIALQRTAWILYGIGTAIVVSSYFEIINQKIAWAGWCIGMVGFAIQFVRLPSRPRF